jgi:zinc D-Ala-D-Ala carboxypeptidase
MSTYIREQSDWKEKWKNFNLDEFKCKCGCGNVSVHSDLLDLLQTARNNIGAITISSAYRCPEHNNKVSSTGEDGPHTTSKAVDIHVSNSQHRKQLIDYFTNKVTGLGIAKTFIHIDILTSDEVPHRPNCWLY